MDQLKGWVHGPSTGTLKVHPQISFLSVYISKPHTQKYQKVNPAIAEHLQQSMSDREKGVFSLGPLETADGLNGWVIMSIYLTLACFVGSVFGHWNVLWSAAFICLGFTIFEYIPSPQRRPIAIKILLISLLLSTACLAHGPLNYSRCDYDYTFQLRDAKSTNDPSEKNEPVMVKCKAWQIDIHKYAFSIPETFVIPDTNPAESFGNFLNSKQLQYYYYRLITPRLPDSTLDVPPMSSESDD